MEKAFNFTFKLLGAIAACCTIFGVTIAPNMLDLSNPYIAFPAAIILMVSSGYLGFALHEYIGKAKSKKDTELSKKQKNESLERTFLSLSKKQLKYVRKALDERGIELKTLDEDAEHLKQLKIFISPPIAIKDGFITYTINPAFIKEIQSHREWFD